MLRRANIYGAFFACGLCLLLLLAGSRYTDNVSYRPAFESRRNIKHFLRLAPEDSDDAAPQLRATAVGADDPPTSNVEEILEKTRDRIKRELANFTFDGIPAVKRLDDLILERGGRPLRNIIVSSWRSGTTFLGEVLNSVPGNFYHYEPLLSYEIIQIRGPPHSELALNRLHKMLSCNFTDMPEYFEYGKTHLHQFNHNSRLWDRCKYDRELCFDSRFTSRFCRIFPFQSMKLVRLRLRLTEKLLADPELNTKVILLVRDPRGVLQSRQHRDFCPPAPDCWQPALLCADMVSDYVAASRLLKLYPHRFTVIRYEDLALEPETSVRRLMEFLQLGAAPGVAGFLREHTGADAGGVSSTFRVSREVPFRWTRMLMYDHVITIQEECSEAMSLWGYRPAYNASHLTSPEFVPLQPYAVH